MLLQKYLVFEKIVTIIFLPLLLSNSDKQNFTLSHGDCEVGQLGSTDNSTFESLSGDGCCPETPFVAKVDV